MFVVQMKFEGLLTFVVGAVKCSFPPLSSGDIPFKFLSNMFVLTVIEKSKECKQG